MKEELFRRREGAPPFIYGHRGVRGAAPENTMAAFDLARRWGADGVELDVRLCRSGELVVCHDPTLLRFTGGHDVRSVADLDCAELSRVDVGGGEHVPLLTEVLAWASAERLRVNVEMKRDVPHRSRVVAETVRVLRSFPHASTHVIVSSFDPWMLVAFARALPTLPIGYLFEFDQSWARSGWLAVPLRASAVHPERTIVDAKHCRAWHERGWCVNVWTVNDVLEARALAALGVDALITDVPGVIGDAVRGC